jgi:hypothetical protein
MKTDLRHCNIPFFRAELPSLFFHSLQIVLKNGLATLIRGNTVLNCRASPMSQICLEVLGTARLEHMEYVYEIPD